MLLIIARQDTMSDALHAAVERAFPWLDVRLIPEAAQARELAQSNTQLILIDLACYAEFASLDDEARFPDPASTVAVMAPMHLDPDDFLVSRILSGAVKGILPTDVNLDIWLSILQIMLKGGEYIPPNLIRKLQGAHHRVADSASIQADLASAARPEAARRMLEKLTTREQEVLCMVAQGCQNKVIAADLELSENTVKIHIHNIIKKLGVHNRTEAAALFFANEKTPGVQA
ncbi:helix-turn-helix transcriptional regulator [Oricola thermophila]|uniref:Response regulator transcription factor n=1 Tax=Oricola thermophila TaxID=2742145 RepID=A0A6N1VHJ6_9HYPH|nr:response regulator transcription factor [Oricola thermophila]QKV19175.1 response regulator transcription factor [Oricola thermophila]